MLVRTFSYRPSAVDRVISVLILDRPVINVAVSVSVKLNCNVTKPTQ